MKYTIDNVFDEMIKNMAQKGKASAIDAECMVDTPEAHAVVDEFLDNMLDTVRDWIYGTQAAYYIPTNHTVQYGGFALEVLPIPKNGPYISLHEGNDGYIHMTCTFRGLYMEAGNTLLSDVMIDGLINPSDVPDPVLLTKIDQKYAYNHPSVPKGFKLPGAAYDIIGGSRARTLIPLTPKVLIDLENQAMDKGAYVMHFTANYRYSICLAKFNSSIRPIDLIKEFHILFTYNNYQFYDAFDENVYPQIYEILRTCYTVLHYNPFALSLFARSMDGGGNSFLDMVPNGIQTGQDGEYTIYNCMGFVKADSKNTIRV